jgi:hypothetical protein
MRDEWRARECAKPMRQIFLRQAIASSIVLAISLASPLPGEAADPVFPPGSRIGLVPPAGMAPSTAFTGFEDSERHAVIVLSELAGSSYPDVEKEFSSEGMRAGGMEVERREDIALKDGPGFLIIARQRLSGTLVHRWALVLSSAAVTAIITTTIPQPAKDAYPDSALRVALSSVTIRAEVPVEEQLAALPYSLGNLAEFRLLRAGRDGHIDPRAERYVHRDRAAVFPDCARAWSSTGPERARRFRPARPRRIARPEGAALRALRADQNQRQAVARNYRPSKGWQEQHATRAGSVAALRDRRLYAHAGYRRQRRMGIRISAHACAARRHRAQVDPLIDQGA